MNTEMAYLLGMILGNGEIQRDNAETRVTIDIPHKNLYTDDMKDVRVYVKASTVDIRSIVEPLIGHSLTVTQDKRSTVMTFVKPNDEYITREILRFIGGGKHHSTMRMNPDLFSITTDEKKTLLRGIADVTGYIRKSNIAYGQDGAHRVYIEIFFERDYFGVCVGMNIASPEPPTPTAWKTQKRDENGNFTK